MKPCRCLLVLLLSVCASAQAASVARTEGFYQGSAEVDSRGRQQRLTATREALVEVLVRMTGDVSVSMTDKAGFILQQAPRYVRSYRYVERAVQPPDEGPEAEGLRKQQYLLVDFDAAALVRAVKENGLPLWDEQRPVTVVWLLAPGDDGARSLWGRVEIEEQFPGLKQAARRRGIPVRLPEMDLEDRSALSSIDVVAEDAVRLEAASARYRARHLLLVRLRQSTPNLWEAQWSFLRDEAGPQRWVSLGEDGSEALANGFDQYADALARVYALELAPGWVQSSRLRVVGLPDIGAYARVMAYLQRLNLVESVQPSEVLGTDVVFLVEFEGTLEDLKRSIELGEMLIPAPEEPPGTARPPEMPGMAGTEKAQSATTMPPASPSAQGPEPSGLSFFAVSRRPELRYRLKP